MYRERGSNPHGTRVPTDFTYHYRFRGPMGFVVWTMPLPYPKT